MKTPPGPLEIPDCRIASEFLRQIAEGQHDIDLTALWGRTGRERKLKPQRWARTHTKAGCSKPRLTRWDDGSITATGKAVAWYVFDCDDRLEEAYFGYYRLRYRDNPVQAIIAEPTPLIATLAICDGVLAYDAPPIGIVFGFLNQVTEWTADLDPLHQESVIANVQRALNNEPHPPTRQELYGDWEIQG